MLSPVLLRLSKSRVLGQELDSKCLKGGGLALNNKRVFIALLYGLICHALFAVAVTMMFFSFYNGMQLGYGKLQGLSAWLCNLLLVAQFPVIHSYLLSSKGQKLLDLLVPKDIAKDMRSTTYVITASIQLLITFTAWSPSGSIWFKASGMLFYLLTILFLCSWLLLLKSMSDSGLSVQSGSLGWTSVLLAKKPNYPRFATHGLFKYCRQPIYLSFALILWTTPVWTPDQLMIAVLWTLYTFIGPIFKERRYTKFYGKDFQEYQKKVPYYFPSKKS